jgi:antitoxin ParD1/3/4
MPTRNINLTEHWDSFVEKEVSSGRYGNASELVRDGLRLIERRNQEESAKLEWLRGAIQEGAEQIERGEFFEIDSEEDLDRVIDGIAQSAEVTR